MKLIVFLKNKKELVIHDGKHFLQQWYDGSKKIFLSKKKKKQTVVARHDIRDFVQARYYHMFKQAFLPIERSYTHAA